MRIEGSRRLFFRFLICYLFCGNLIYWNLLTQSQIFFLPRIFFLFYIEWSNSSTSRLEFRILPKLIIWTWRLKSLIQWSFWYWYFCIINFMLQFQLIIFFLKLSKSPLQFFIIFCNFLFTLGFSSIWRGFNIWIRKFIHWRRFGIWNIGQHWRKTLALVC